MSVKSLIAEELSLAGEASPVSPLVLQLDKFRIMSDTDVPPEEFLLRLFGKPGSGVGSLIRSDIRNN